MLESFKNEEVDDLIWESRDGNTTINRLKEISLRLNEIRSNCKHDFKLISEDVYSRYYQCKECGELYEK